MLPDQDFARKAFAHIGQGISANNMMSMVYAEYDQNEGEPSEVSDNSQNEELGEDFSDDD